MISFINKGAYIVVATLLSSLMLAVLNIVYAYAPMQWIIIACRACSLVVLLGLAFLVRGLKFEDGSQKEIKEE